MRPNPPFGPTFRRLRPHSLSSPFSPSLVLPPLLRLLGMDKHACNTLSHGSGYIRSPAHSTVLHDMAIHAMQTCDANMLTTRPFCNHAARTQVDPRPRVHACKISTCQADRIRSTSAAAVCSCATRSGAGACVHACGRHQRPQWSRPSSPARPDWPGSSKTRPAALGSLLPARKRSCLLLASA